MAKINSPQPITYSLTEAMMSIFRQLEPADQHCVRVIADKLFFSELSAEELVRMTSEAKKMARESGSSFRECFADIYPAVKEN